MVTSEEISIIVPVFNTAPYLNQCIDSVLNQTYTEWELILINDGSTDGSAKICEEYCQTDNRIILISYTENRGASYARNRGIETSKGKYLFFLDSDDALHPVLLEEMKKAAEKEAGIVISNYKNTEESSIPKKWGNSSINWNLIPRKHVLEWWLNSSFEAKWGIGGKLFLKSQVGNLRFDEQIRNSEDVLFIYRFLKESNVSLAYTSEKSYWRILRDVSVSHESTIMKIYDELHVWHEIINSELSIGREKNVIICKERLVSILCNLYSDPANFAPHNRTLIKEIIAKEREKGMFNHIRYRVMLKYILCMLTPTLYRRLRNVKGVEIAQCEHAARNF